MSRDKEIAKQTIEILRPHFTFNVLNQMKYQIGKNPDLAQEMVYDFANFYRASLTLASGEELTLLDEELRAFKSYLRLECGMNRNLAVELQLSREKDVRQWIVRTGILQKFGADLVREEIRTTKEERTLCVADQMKDGLYSIHVKIHETGKEFTCPVCEIKEE